MAASGVFNVNMIYQNVEDFYHLQAPIYEIKYNIDNLVKDADNLIHSSTSGKVGAFLFEPLQGYGGIHVLPNDYINKMSELREKMEDM